MKIIRYLLVLLFIPGLALAQTNAKIKGIYILQLTSNSEIVTENLFMSPRDIESLEFMKQPEVKKRFGEQITLVMIVKPKNYVKLMNLADFFDAYNVPFESQQYPIIVDSVLSNIQGFLICREFIRSVQIVDDAIRITSNLTTERQGS